MSISSCPGSVAFLLLAAFTLAMPCGCAAHASAPAHGAHKPVPVRAPQPARSHARRLAHGHYRYSTYLIPPPPAYMPSILPELAVRGATTSGAEPAVAKKPENPYSKYVHTPEGDAPEPVQTRKGVVTWSHRS